MDNTMNASLRPKKIRVSRKRQITIPIKYFTRFGITDEVECVPTENGILLRPVISDEEKGEFDDYILADLIKEGYSGDSLTGLVTFDSGDTSSTVDMNALYGSTSASLADDAIYYAQLLITHGDSTLTSQIVKIETSSISGSADPYFGDGGFGFETLPGQTLDATYGAFSPTGWTSSAMPEPTSGLLLLVGAGLLGLRRKRA